MFWETILRGGFLLIQPRRAVASTMTGMIFSAARTKCVCVYMKYANNSDSDMFFLCARSTLQNNDARLQTSCC
jgi:hypothetical protein